MCEECNLKILTPEQLQAVSTLPIEIKNTGMLIRHIENGMVAYATTKRATMTPYHTVIEAGTRVILTEFFRSRMGAGEFSCTVVGRNVTYRISIDSLDMKSVEWGGERGKNEHCT